MAKRDVELIIRAKDEATRAVDSVSKAIQTLVGSQTDLVTSADKTDSALARLGQAVGLVNKQFAGMTAVARATAQLDRATQSMNRLQQETGQTAADQERIAAATAVTAQRMADLAVEADQTATAIARQKAQLIGTQGAQAAYGAQVTKTERTLTRLDKGFASLTAQIARQGQVISQNEQRYDSIRQKMEATVAPSKTLTAQFIAASNALAASDARLTELNVKQAENRASMEATSATLAQLQARLAAANADYRTQAANLTVLESRYKQIAQATRAAAQEQDNLVAASVETNDALQRQATEIVQAEKALQDAVVEMDKLTAANAKLAAAGVGVLIRALREQTAETVKSRAEWKALSKAAAELKAELVSTAEPTERMVADYERLRAATLQARAEFEAQGKALSEMRGALFATRAGTISLADAQTRFAASAGTLAANLREVRSSTGQTATEFADLAGMAERNAKAMQDLGQATQKVVVQQRGGVTATNSFAAALQALYGKSRQAMSITQRLRGEVLSLIAAYGGIFGAIQGIQNLVEATLTLQRAQSRLGVIFEGDFDKVASEMEFLRRNADFLGISLGTLSESYSKFASSTLDTNIEGAKTREIFLAVADAGAVLGLSVDDLNGVFKALGQIASKSQVQMEELRGQLGDRFPAALKLMADGLGVTVQELNDMVKAGEVSSDALIGFADQIVQRYGKELPAALSRLPALLGRLGQAAFNALVIIGSSGFIEEFSQFIATLTDFLQSGQAITFFQKLGFALGVAVDALEFLIEHIQLTVTLFGALIGLKLAPFIANLALGLFNLGSAFIKAGQNARTAALMMNGTTASFAAAGTAAAVLRREMILLGATTGVGLAIAGIGAALGAWITSTDNATDALARHGRLMDEINTKYDRLEESVENWRKALDEVTTHELQQDLKRLNKEITSSNRAMDALIASFEVGVAPGTEAAAQISEVRRLTQEFQALGGATADQEKAFREALGAIGEAAAAPVVEEIVNKTLDWQKATVDTRQAIDGTAKALSAKLNPSLENLAESQDALRNNPFDAMEDGAAALAGATEEASKAAQDLEKQWRQLTDEAQALDGVVNRVGKSMQEWVEINPGVKIRRELAEAQIAAETLNETNSTLPDAFFEMARGAEAAKDAITDANAAAKDTDPSPALAQTSEALKRSFEQVPVVAEGAFREIEGGLSGLVKTIETEAPADALAAPFDRASSNIIDVTAKAGEEVVALTDTLASKLTPEQLVEPFEGMSAGIVGVGESINQVGASVTATSDAIALGVIDATLAIQTTAGLLTSLPATVAGAFAPVVETIKTSLAEVPPTVDITTSSILGILNIFANSTKGTFSSVANSIEGSFNALGNSVEAVIARLIDELNELENAIDSAKAAAESASASVPGRAKGGSVHGAGTSTSDSILSRLSKGEFVIRAAAVRKYGVGLMTLINNMMMPKALPSFATGGPVSIPVDVLPQFLDSGIFGEQATAKPTRVVNLTFGDETFEGLVAPEPVAQALVRYSRRRQVRSGGRKPSWLGRGSK